MTEANAGVRARAVVLLVRDGRLLAIARHKRGEDYLVLPGGGIEPGESPSEAAARELTEETGLVAAGLRPLWTRDDADRPAHYFLVDDPGGEPVLGSPERERVSPENRYAFRWLDADELDRADLRPAGLAPVVRTLLED